MKHFIIFFVIFSSCSFNKEKVTSPLPEKIAGIENGILVRHSADTVYATINTKDPEKRGEYQLLFATSVSSKKGNISIEEFGAYVLEGNKWVAKSIYNRPFNNLEFAKWYNCSDGLILEGKTYSDSSNWLRKTNKLTNEIMVSLWYFIGINEEGKKVVGVKEIVGIVREK